MVDKEKLSLGELDMIIFNIGVIASNCSFDVKVNDYYLRDELNKRNRMAFDYQNYLLDRYSDEDLYVIINELKEFYYDDNIVLPVNRIISSLSKSLYDRLPVEKEEDFSDVVVSFSNRFYEIMDQKDNCNMDDAFNYLELVSLSCTSSEERALVMTLDHSEDEVSSFIVNSINMDIYSKTFKEYFSSKGINSKVKK
ncbi:MAG: hypothetical protein IJN90_07695 [Bacilli bacterium]|nr:hypothetical protein [Bacilli bacterium]